jgi:hypothetical protein
MNEFVVQEFGALVQAQANKSLVAFQPPSVVNNTQIEERRVAYYKVGELVAGWGWLYRNHIYPAMRNDENVGLATEELLGIIGEFDAAMIDVAPLGGLRRQVTEQLEELKIEIETKPTLRRFARLRGDTLARAERRRRSLIRKRSERVMNGLQKMREKAETPAWLRRFYKRIWGQVDSVFDLDPDERERVRLLAHGIFGEASRKAAEKLLDPEVAQAFRTLQLDAWAKQQEMHERYIFLIKQCHPDLKRGDDKRASEINNAKDILDAYFQSPTKKT